jgi:hypothetical protein
MGPAYPASRAPKRAKSSEVVTARRITHGVGFTRHADREPPAANAAWRRCTRGKPMLFLLWLLAVILVVAGIVTALRGAVLYGIALIILGLLVGPGGVSIFN